MSSPPNWLELRIAKWLLPMFGFALIILMSFFVLKHFQRAENNRNLIRDSKVDTEADGLPETFALVATPKAKQRYESIQLEVHADAKAWPTEAFSESATKKLKSWLSEVAKGNLETPSDLVATSFQADRLRPTSLDVVLKTDTTEVRRWKADSFNESASLQDSMQSLTESIAGEHHIYPKLIRVEQTITGFDTTVLVEGGGDTSSGKRQWTATWKCSWNASEATAKLSRIVLSEYEEVESQIGAWLVDTTGTVLGDSEAYQQQLLYGMDYWVNKLEHRMYVNRLGHHGLAIGDANGDGLEDLYVCQPGGLPNRLLLHQTNGTAVDAAIEAGLRFLDDTTAALFADFDNDGDEDLAILTVSGGFIFANDSKGKFDLRATMPDCRNAFSLTAADFDQDGKLDLYIGRYWPEESGRGAIPLPVPYYDALNGGRNVLLRNEGGWKFSDVTKSAGLDVDNTRYTMAAAWEDFDDDGDQDLYVANDFGRNCLYENNAGQFENVAAKLAVEDTAAGMSVSWADYDHDGKTDLYVGNMFSSAGNRITYQQYEKQFDDAAQKKLQRLARGNSLFRNRGTDPFEDQSVHAGVTMGRWAWGSLFVDLNNDSWDDLVIANGHVTTKDTGDL